MAENRASASLKTEQPEFDSDTTGNDPIDGTRHVMQDEMQAADVGVFEKSAKSTKERTAAPETGAAVELDTSPPKPAKRTAKRK